MRNLFIHSIFTLSLVILSNSLNASIAPQEDFTGGIIVIAQCAAFENTYDIPNTLSIPSASLNQNKKIDMVTVSIIGRTSEIAVMSKAYRPDMTIEIEDQDLSTPLVSGENYSIVVKWNERVLDTVNFTAQ